MDHLEPRRPAPQLANGSDAGDVSVFCLPNCPERIDRLDQRDERVGSILVQKNMPVVPDVAKGKVQCLPARPQVPLHRFDEVGTDGVVVVEPGGGDKPDLRREQTGNRVASISGNVVSGRFDEDR